MPPSKVRPEDTYAAFATDERVKRVAVRLGVSYLTLRRWWVARFGQEAVAARTSRFGATPEDTYAAFPTEEPFKSVAARMGLSPNTLRSWWIAKFGQEAFDSRGKSIQAHAAIKFGRSRRGQTHQLQRLTRTCSACGEVLHLNSMQVSRLRAVLCPPCRDKSRGVDQRCPVCDFGCVGNRALISHLTRPKTGFSEAHATYLAEYRRQKDARRWEGLEEDQDYVICRVCGRRGVSLTNHMKRHGLLAAEYYAKFPGAHLTPPRVESRRMEALAPYYKDLSYGWSKETLGKYVDERGQVIVAEAARDLGASPATVLGYCKRWGLPTRNRLAWQRTVLDAAAKALRQPYRWEWSDPRIINPISGRVLNYDGYFPGLNLLVEAHGDQHFQFSEAWHGTPEGFAESRERDAFKKQCAEERGYRYVMVRTTDPIWDSTFWHDCLNLKPASPVDTSPILSRLRATGFPEARDDEKELRTALSKLQKMSPHLSEGALVYPYSTVGSTACVSFFPGRYRVRLRGKLSAWEAWHDDDLLRKAIQLQVDSGHPTTPLRVLRALVLYHRTPSVFRPVVAKFVYERFCPPNGTVWDPCVGFGGRLLGAIAAGVQYLGTDVEQPTVDGNIRMSTVLGVSTRIVCTRAENFDPGVSLDLVFTSPPYFDLEDYGAASKEAERSYASAHGWVRQFLRPVVRTAANRLRGGGHLVLNLPSRPVNGVRLDLEAVHAAEEVGLTPHPTFWMPVRTFRGTLRGEPILVWSKPR
jgi:hypothetical protein